MANETNRRELGRAWDGISGIDDDVTEVLHNESGPSGYSETVFVHREAPLTYRRPWSRPQQPN